MFFLLAQKGSFLEEVVSCGVRQSHGKSVIRSDVLSSSEKVFQRFDLNLRDGHNFIINVNK